MKREGYIYEKICHKENIRMAIMSASKGKKNRDDVKRVLSNLTYYVDKIQDMLVRESYIPNNYKVETIKEGISQKERIIYKPNFYPDQIIQWAIILQISPVLSKGMYEFSCGSIPNRGVHYGKRYVERWVKSDHKNTKYYLKLDINKFYPSVNINNLQQKLRTKIKDKKVLALLDVILNKNEGLPIGILISQWMANFYLQDLDHYIKEKLKIKYYIRYMDDMILFGRNKKELHKVRVLISNFLNKEGLKLKHNWQLYKFSCEPLDFMGFRFYRNKTTIRKSIMLRITRKVNKIYKKSKPTYNDACSMLSYMGWIKNTDSFNLFNDRIKPYINISQLKNIIRKEARKQNEKIQKPICYYAK